MYLLETPANTWQYGMPPISSHKAVLVQFPTVGVETMGNRKQLGNQILTRNFPFFVLLKKEK